MSYSAKTLPACSTDPLAQSIQASCQTQPFLVSDAVFTFLASKQNLERADFDPFGTIALMVKTNPSQLAYSIGSSAPPT